MSTYPSTGLFDLLRLASRLIKAGISGADRGEAFRRWLEDLTARYDSPNVVLNLLLRRVLFVSGPGLSAHVLAGAPSDRSYLPGTPKRKAMSFLAPHALTIAHGAEWHTLRRFNEEVLQTGRDHPHQQAILALVRQSFSHPVADVAEIRQVMGTVMLGTVFGENRAPAHLIGDIQTLFGEVNLRTALIGSRKMAERDRFRAELRRLFRSATALKDESLVSLARVAGAEVAGECCGDDVLADQIPHWMFTFTGSGSDLLAHSLALILARPEVLKGVQQEIAAAGPLHHVETIRRLHQLEACILEAGRLYPPAPQTAHRAAQADSYHGTAIPAGTELLQVFAFGTRDLRRDPTANDFRPERWLDPANEARRRYPNLFLSGARACPGRDLILFVVKAAAAHQLHDPELPTKRNRLTSDPLPFSFPQECLRF